MSSFFIRVSIYKKEFVGTQIHLSQSGQGVNDRVSKDIGKALGKTLLFPPGDLRIKRD